MPGCAAIDCSNSAKKGFLMKKFPKDPLRRKEWLIKMKRDNWKPTDYSCLCEVHFAPDMWEKIRVDGTRKLRSSAVPTLFSFTSSITKNKRRSPAKRNELPVAITISSASTFADSQVEPALSALAPSTSSSTILLEATRSQSFSENSLSPERNPERVEELGIMEKLEQYSQLYNKHARKVRYYKKMLRNMKRKVKDSEATINRSSEYTLLKTVFNDDQIKILQKRRDRKIGKIMRWSNETVTKALKLRFSCGTSGYEELIKQQYPLPSTRTLQRRLQNLKFDSGILHEVFKFLKIKCDTFKPGETDCILVFDEAAITPGRNYDMSLNKFFGDVTLPDHNGTATHVLVFMLAGVTLCWKQVVAYYFTGNSVNGQVFSNIIKDILMETQKLNLNVLSITSDMGACNQALWKMWGIMAGRFSLLKCKIENPLKEDHFIHIFADVPHLFKNIKNMLMTNKIIYLPEQICEKFGLPSREVHSRHIEELIKYQEKCHFKLAPKLSSEDVMPTHFGKMKVSTSTNVVNHSVSSALKFVAEVENKPDYLTTAWFLDQVERWFYIMTSRHVSCALSKFNVDVYEKTIQFLKDFMDLFTHMEVGIKKIWKPAQSGTLISTQSVLELQKYLLEEKKYEFVLTSRFSQDCLENLFCVLRSKQVVPNAMQVKNNLKLITVSQYLKHPNSGSYEEDERKFLSGFLDTLTKNDESYCEVFVPENVNFPGLHLSHSDSNSLYNIAGYLMQSIQRTSKTCDICLSSVASKTPLCKNFSKFVNIKMFKANTLFFCTELVFHFFIEIETIFQKYITIVISQNIDIKKFFVEKMISLDLDVPNCHKIKEKIVKRFVVFRLKIYSNKRKDNKKIDKFASKSVAGYTL